VSATIDIPGVNGKIVAVLGLGKTGHATVAALRAAGATIWAWDDNEAARAPMPQAEIVDLAKADWSLPAMLVMSPGIPHTHPKPHPAAAKARTHGTPIIGDIELLYRACPDARYVCVTGTNGKSTTTALIGHILKTAGKRCAVGGNLGQAALTLAALGEDGVYVLEMSSYQIELTPSAIADVAILLNITPDHLDRHGGMAGYIAAKERIFAAKPGGTGIIGVDDAPSRAMLARLDGANIRRFVPVSGEAKLERGIYVENGMLIDAGAGNPVAIMDLSTVASLPGAHNWQNAAAAYAACRALGLAIDAIVAGLESYPGLAHRQERVATLGSVLYVNDSKATNAAAAAKALGCYDAVYWIAGGRAKEGGLAGLETFYPRIRHAYLIGEAAGAFETQLGGAIPVSQCATLERALAAAHAAAQAAITSGAAKHAVVLLSPACASWDQYANFEARGDHFRALVQELQAAARGKGAA